MQRYSGGLEVPRQMLDVFSGETSSGVGFLYLTLSYTPQSLDHVIVPSGYESTVSHRRGYQKLGLVGNVLTVVVLAYKYWKADTPTGTETVTDTGGAAPHGHTISHTAFDVIESIQSNEAQDDIVVQYQVA